MQNFGTSIGVYRYQYYSCKKPHGLPIFLIITLLLLLLLFSNALNVYETNKLTKVDRVLIVFAKSRAFRK